MLNEDVRMMARSEQLPMISCVLSIVSCLQAVRTVATHGGGNPRVACCVENKTLHLLLKVVLNTL